MTFAEKLTQLRKDQGWSQETFAQQMDVSRQAVSKWESGQSLPDYDKLIAISDLFSVSLDYLLRDGEEMQPCPKIDSGEISRRWLAGQLTWGVLLALLAPFLVVVMTMLGDYVPAEGIQNFTAYLGLAGVLTLTAGALFLVYRGVKALHSGGLEGAEKEGTQTWYQQWRVWGLLLCGWSPVPMLLCLNWQGRRLGVLMMLAMLGAGSTVLIWNLIVRGTRPYLRLRESLWAGYWLLATAPLFAWAYSAYHWDLFPVVVIAAELFFLLVCLMAEFLPRHK